MAGTAAAKTPSPDVLRRNYVELVRDMRCQGYICDVLRKQRVLSEENYEEIMHLPTNAARNRELLTFVRTRFKMAFDPFCDA